MAASPATILPFIQSERKMRFLFIITIAPVILTASPGYTQTTQAEDVPIKSLTEQFSKARDHFDAKALDGLLAPDYVEVSPLGDIDRRPEVLGFYTADKAKPLPTMTNSIQSLRVHGDTAIVIGSVNLLLPVPTGGTVERTLRVTYVEQRIGNRWFMSSVQYTGVRPPKAAQ